MSYNVYDAECSSRYPAAWYGLFYYSVHLADILSKTFASSDTVFWSPARRYLQVFLSLYRANREISKVCLQIVFGYVKIRVGKCKSRTGLLILFLSAATYILGIPENKYELWGFIK